MSPQASASPKPKTPTRQQRIARKRALHQTTILDNPWLPDEIKDGLTPRQLQFLLYEGREALYGGAAGGGKSVAILAAALQWACEPKYKALVMRRTFAQLDKADSILDKAKEWLLGRKDERGRKASYNDKSHKFRFPSGATLEFGHMEHERAMLNYQGGAWAYIGVDEVTQFTEQMVAYPRTRQRRAKGSLVPVRWRGASNPGGPGHLWVKDRYIASSDGVLVSYPGREFFPATLDDNPHIDREDYIRQLKESGIDSITLKQLLEGDWDAVAGGRFKREWWADCFYDRRGDLLQLSNGKQYLLRECKVFGTTDPAASEDKDACDTACSAWAITPCNLLVWLDCVSDKWDINDVLEPIEGVYDRNHCGFMGIEGVAANDAVYRLARRTRMNVKRLNPLSKDKLVRATPAIVLAEEGRLYFPRYATWKRKAETQLVLFTGDPDKDAASDIIDTLSYAVEEMREPNQARGKPGMIPHGAGMFGRR